MYFTVSGLSGVGFVFGIGHIVELGVEGVLPEAEEIMAARDIVIAETNKVHAHICHISTETSVNIIKIY